MGRKSIPQKKVNINLKIDPILKEYGKKRRLNFSQLLESELIRLKDSDKKNKK